ncbi:MAG TPA: L-2-hydroxyglutarate oxidase [Solibacterales bacterium]|nr:L-2-hydroxyglutarate oxidase [Bryobacterales bacterium]
MRILIAGGGIVGLASALRLSEALPQASIQVLEKERKAGQHQTGHNSGVLHCGLYYKPGSLKARLAVEGIRQMVSFCEHNGVAHEICGKLVVAADESEIPRLKELEQRGTQNGLEGLRWLSREEMREREPHVGGVAGLRVPQEGIVDYAAVCQAMVRRLAEGGHRLVTGARVRRMRRVGSAWIAATEAGDFEGDFVLNCAGLHSDRVSAMTGRARELRIVPFRGEYYQIRPERQHLVRHLIYPVPDPRFPFLGVHFTRMIQGGVEAGPNAVLAFAREGYKKTDISIPDLVDALSYSGLWRFLAKYPAMCAAEMARSFSKRRFCESLQRLVPEIQAGDLAPGGAGVRAQALEPDGSVVQDFRFAEAPGALHVLNAPSPAATASLAIGAEVARRVAARLN